ncbi:MAG TPA: hypothetical protein ENK33_09040 [Desulfobacterales bacterium]|nr:hypothetical protein [Desulfobacterales bacterium]
MKINDLKTRRLTARKTAKNSKSLPTPEVGFQALLNGLKTPEEIAASPAVEAPAPAAATSPAVRLQGLSLSESSIDLLDSLSRGLADLTLKSDDLTPLVDSLEMDSTALLDIKEQLPKDDPLARLIDRVTAVTYIEVEKFRRGDYR